MKLSNFLLSVVAAFALGAAVSASLRVVATEPTVVNYIPAKEGTMGGGMNVKLPANPTNRQAQLLALAYDTAKRDGHRYPQLLQGIILQESRAGEMKRYKVAGEENGLPVNKRYYGVSQIKLSAARDVLNRFPYMWDRFHFQTRTDEEVIAKLIENDAFNIAVASKYLLILRDAGYTTPHALAIAYNRGPSGARGAGPTTQYSRGVMQHIEKMNRRQVALQT